MIKTIQKSAKTEDEAVRLALEELGLEMEDVSIEILELPKAGVLGFGSRPAVVAVSYEVPDPEPVEETPAPAKAKAAPAEKSESPAAQSVQKTSVSVSDGEKVAKVHDFIDGLLVHFGVPAQIELSEDEEGTVNVVLTASEAGALIGRRGETLDAIQHLTNYAVNHSDGKRLRVNIDTENYRERRSETLEALATKTAAKVVKYRRNFTLDPMNAYERHVIHVALQEHEVVSTHSVGSEPNRRVVVTYGKNSDGVREFSNGGNRGGRRDSRSRGGRSEEQQSKSDSTESTAQSVDSEPSHSEAVPPSANPMVREWL